MSQFKATGQVPRKSFIDDPNAELRPTSAAAIADLDGDFSEPAYEGPIVEFGNVRRMGRVRLLDFVITPNTANDGFAHIALLGVSQDENTKKEIAALRVGNVEMITGSADDASGDDLELIFDTATRGALWPKVQLVVTGAGTQSLALDFRAIMIPIEPIV